MRSWFSRKKKENATPVPEPAQLEQQAAVNDEPAAQPEPVSSVQVEAPVEPLVEPPTAESISATPPTAEIPIEKPESRVGFFQRLVRGLAKSRSTFVVRITQVLSGRSAIDDELYDDLEEVLIQADVGANTAAKLVAAVKKSVARDHVTNPLDVEGLLKAEMIAMLQGPAAPLCAPRKGELVVFLVVGVNGAGKTTTIGKLAARYKSAGFRVVLGAGDTFRAAAIEQLEAWGERAGVDVIKHQEGSDPAAVAFDAVQAAKARKADVLIIDTAGRLQTKTHLMQELAKINRVVERELGRKPDEVLLVLDATTGQNGLSQARVFSEATPVTGVVLTKLDGTARGGVVLAVAADMQLPVKMIGIGEAIEDLRDFSAPAFVAALFTHPGAETDANP